jgi:signal-transduction protein with cAMP-binding, CBS, and nucleotidyltransferase domain
MRDSGSRAAVVVDADRKSAIGIVSLETLAWEVIAAEKNPAATRLSEVMSDEFASVKESDSLFDTIRFMFDHGLQCVVITEDDGRLGGLVTLEELFAELTMELIEFSTVEEHAVDGAVPERAGLPRRSTAPVREAIAAASPSPALDKESLDRTTVVTRH